MPTLRPPAVTADVSALSSTEAAVRLHVSERTIRRYLEHGKLAGTLVETQRGQEWRIAEADIAAYQQRKNAIRAQPVVAADSRGQPDRTPSAPGAEVVIASLTTHLTALIDERQQLVDRVERQAEELGVLREKVRGLEAAVQDRDRAMQSAAWHDAQDDSDRARFTQGEGEDAPVVPEPAPKPRPRPSWRERLGVWLGLRALKDPRNRVF